MNVLRVLDRRPATLPLLLRAALPAVPGVSALPGLRRSGSALPDLVVSRRGVAVDRDRVDAYARVCGFAPSDVLPATYLHVPAFTLHLALMTDRSFPFPAMGLVHLANVLRRQRTTTVHERYDVTVSAADLRPHPKGRVFDMLTEVSVDGEVVWDEVSTYLRRGAGGASEAEVTAADLPVVEGAGAEWRLGGDLGRRYAAVSGDRNPIHLYAVTARAFGFRRQIAHGMWSKARCVAALEELPDDVRVEVAFRRPVVLPATVRFAARRAGAEVAFSLADAADGTPHLAGRATPLA